MKNLLLALVFVLLLVGAALAVNANRAVSVGVNGVPAAGECDPGMKASGSCGMKAAGMEKKSCGMKMMKKDKGACDTSTKL